MKSNIQSLRKIALQISSGLKFFLHVFIGFVDWFMSKLSRAILRFIVSFFVVVFEFIIYPFRSLRHFWRSMFVVTILSIFFVMIAYNLAFIHNTFGLSSMLCYFSHSEEDSPKGKVVRIVGEWSEGSGFFIYPNKVITNFHVIEGEPAPKIIFPDGHFVTPYYMVHDPVLDLAALTVDEYHPEMVLETTERSAVFEDTPLFAYGYPMGVNLIGEATVSKGSFITTRKSHNGSELIQTSIDLTDGMSGGPLTDYCGRVVGVNTLGVAGLSMFIPVEYAYDNLHTFQDAKITKIELHPEESPAKAVEAFYTNLRLRRMEDGYALLSSQYQQGATQAEWTARFTNILSVGVVGSEALQNESDTVFVKFMTQNWNGEIIEVKYYEGTWKTVREDGIYRLDESNIKELEKPGYEWFYG